LLFKWTFPEKIEKESLELTLFNYQSVRLLFDFPWINFKLFEPPIVKNSLEYPISFWDQVEPLLLTDLEKFTNSPHLKSPNKISCLNWNISLYDISKVKTEIYFRYPLSLEEDQKHNFSTILSQFKIAFEQFQFKLKEKTKDTDLANVPIIIAWEIEIHRIVKFSERTNSLFLELKEKEQTLSDIKQFQNKIEAEISIFKINEVHIPSLDYTTTNLNSLMKEINLKDVPKEKTELSHRRFLMKPLFIYEQPVSFTENEIKHKRYLERTASPWWQTSDLNDSYRDYHICEKNDGQLIWAYQNYKGNWYIHGLYS
jgi:hypothetical protein